MHGHSTLLTHWQGAATLYGKYFTSQSDLIDHLGVLSVLTKCPLDPKYIFNLLSCTDTSLSRVLEEMVGGRRFPDLLMLSSWSLYLYSFDCHFINYVFHLVRAFVVLPCNQVNLYLKVVTS